MVILTQFIIGMLVSLLGSLPLGVLNLMMVEISIHKGLRKASNFAIAASSVEFVQGYIAVLLSAYLATFQELNVYFQMAMIPIFLGLAIYYFLQKGTTKKVETDDTSEFKKGFLLSVVNPMAIPFWLIWATHFQAQGLITFEEPYRFVFVLGISVGAFLTLMFFGWTSELLAKRMTSLSKSINSIIAVVFLTLGLYQSIKLIVES